MSWSSFRQFRNGLFYWRLSGLFNRWVWKKITDWLSLKLHCIYLTLFNLSNVGKFSWTGIPCWSFYPAKIKLLPSYLILWLFTSSKEKGKFAKYIPWLSALNEPVNWLTLDYCLHAGINTAITASVHLIRYHTLLKDLRKLGKCDIDRYKTIYIKNQYNTTLLRSLHKQQVTMVVTAMNWVMMPFSL